MIEWIFTFISVTLLYVAAYIGSGKKLKNK